MQRIHFDQCQRPFRDFRASGTRQLPSLAFAAHGRRRNHGRHRRKAVSRSRRTLHHRFPRRYLAGVLLSPGERGLPEAKNVALPSTYSTVPTMTRPTTCSVLQSRRRRANRRCTYRQSVRRLPPPSAPPHRFFGKTRSRLDGNRFGESGRN